MSHNVLEILQFIIVFIFLVCVDVFMAGCVRFEPSDCFSSSSSTNSESSNTRPAQKDFKLYDSVRKAIVNVCDLPVLTCARVEWTQQEASPCSTRWGAKELANQAPPLVVRHSRKPKRDF